MSKAWRDLQRSYREVSTLYADLYDPVFSQRDWKSNVFARRTLGDGIEVELSYLAEHFLLAWHDWWSMCQRYLRYFGQSEDRLPATWWKLSKKSKSLTYRVSSDPNLAFMIAKNWAPESDTRLAMKQTHSDVHSMCHQLILGHRRTAAYLALRSQAEGWSDDFEKQGIPNPVLSRIDIRISRALDFQLEAWFASSRKVQEGVLWHLRRYQHATLAVSWLLEEELNTSVPTSAFMWLLISEKVVQSTLADAVNQMILDEKVLETLNKMLSRIGTAINEIGYEQFIGDLVDKDFQCGDDTLVGTAEIDLIPGHDTDQYHSVLLAVSKDDKRAIGFPKIMKRVREHLIRAKNAVKAVVVISDYWWSGMLDDHLGDLQAHHANGVQFLFLMVGTPGRVVSPIAVDLNAIDFKRG